MATNGITREHRGIVRAFSKERRLSKSDCIKHYTALGVHPNVMRIIFAMPESDFYQCKYADPECFIDEITKSGLPKPNSLEHAKLCVAVHEQSTSEFKADSRIRSFIEFGDFQPRPDAVPPPPDLGPPTLKMFFEVNQEMCGGANEAAFDLCRSVWCADNDCSGEAETYGDFVARQ
jgi:hypothetical protein